MEPDHTEHSSPHPKDRPVDPRREDPHLRLLLKRAPAIAWTTDRDLVFTSLQGAGLEALGIAPGRLVGVRLDDYAGAHQDGDVALDIHRRALAGESLTLEGGWAGRRYEGWLEPLVDDGGTIAGCTGLVLDVTERARAQAELRAAHDEPGQHAQAQAETLSQDRKKRQEQHQELRSQNKELDSPNRELEAERDLLNTIMDSTQAQIAYLDTQFNFVRVNAAYCQGSGHAREELIGRNHFELFPNDENRALFERVRDTREAAVVRAKPFIFADQPERGTTYWDWTLTPLMDQADRVQGVVLSLYDVTETERARQARRARLARARTLVDVSEQVLAETSMEGVLVRVVDAACELTGAKIGTSGHGYREGIFQVGATARAEDVPPCPPGEVFGVKRGGVYVNLIQDAASVRLTDDEMRAHPAWWGLPEGHTSLRGLLGARLVDRDGQANGLIMVSDKIDGGIPAEFTAEDEALLVQLASLTSLALWHIEARMENERFSRRNELILGSAGEGILGLDVDLNVIFANPAAEELIGWKAEELIGRPVHDMIHHTKADGTPYPRQECLVDTTLANGAIFSVSEEVFWRKDGTSFFVEYTSTPIMEESKVAGAVLVFRDITEHKQAEEALKAERVRLETVLEHLPEGVIIAEAPSGKLVLANAQVARIWQHGFAASQDIVEYGAYKGFHPDGRPYLPHEWPLARTITKGEVVEQELVKFQRGDGSFGWMSISSAPIRDERDDVSAGVVTFSDVTERQQAQQAIADLARFPDENPNPVIRISREGVILYANRGSKSLLARWGVKMGEQAPDDWRELVIRAIASGANSVLEVSADGKAFALAIAPLEEYVNIYGLDVTPLKQIEEALHRYAERLHVLHETDQAILAARTEEEIAAAVLSHMQQLIPIVQASVTLFDTKAAQMSLLALYTRGETTCDRAWRHPLAQDPILAKLGEGQVHVAEDLDDTALTSPVVQMLSTQGVHDQGVRAYASVPLIVQKALIGSLNLGLAAPGVLGEEEIEIAREIADELAIGIQQARLLEQVQRHAETLERQVRRRTAALHASQARFQAVFEDSALGIALVDRKGQIIDSNPALQEMLGYSKDELEGVVFAGLAHPDNVQDDADLHDELMAGERTHYQVQGRYVRQDGRAIDVNLTVSLVRPAKGRPRFAIALIEDVTERKQAQRALIEAEKLALTGRLAASLAHEVNNPLQSVIGYMSLVEEMLPQGTDVQEYAEIALGELERVAGIVARMRDLSRPSDPGERESVDVNALLERVLLLTRKRFQNHQIEVQWEAGKDLPLLKLAPDRIQQVFLNLVLNAADAMAADTKPEGRRLRVRTARTQEVPGVQITVADNGVGIPPGEQDCLFEPFHTSKEVGLGLGLYISQSIIQDHGGQIEVESQEGKGTTFSVWLPCQGTPC